MIENVYTSQPPAHAKLLGTLTAADNRGDPETALKKLSEMLQRKKHKVDGMHTAIYAVQFSMGYADILYAFGTLASIPESAETASES